ncbi:MAG: diaminopimelate epimerase [Candidatus Spechtbacteria bacterium SB0662_bin_43]|uniref:Diaminopimelate epimerase n=1 Tax=Candidatus Spechtbacteria bacterium SB0662_bin_43 TaxID=2604897 RepID=A0A845D8N0_9BACT|nr:diaminopimelate epimerase [Candidatus Spechtbacteria bacterium SB0662_bin_43]
MSIPFTKVQGIGNDFILIDALGSNSHFLNRDWTMITPKICDRHFGIGADGILIAADSNNADAHMVIVNADGSYSDMCGNGIRCFVKYLIERADFKPKNRNITVETGSGIVQVEIHMSGSIVDSVRVAMEPVVLDPETIPVLNAQSSPDIHHTLQINNTTYDLACIGMGNPHAVLFIDMPIDDFPLTDIGPIVETHPDFPNKTNFEVANIVSPHHIKMRVWERGVGVTLACGSGACAVLVAARLRGLSDKQATVSLPGGDLKMQWDGTNNKSEPVYMSGPAQLSFTGMLPIPDTE